MPLTTASTVCVTPHQVSCTIDGEAAILQTRDGLYYGLDPIGARVWELLQQPVSVDTIRERITTEYDVSDAEAEKDILELIDDLMHAGLVEIK